MENVDGCKAGYRLVNGTKLKIESMSKVIDNPFINKTIQYVTHIIDKDTEEPLTPTFSSLTYDDKDGLFYIDDEIRLEDQLAHLCLVLDEELNIVGNLIYNDYFDETDYISGLGNNDNGFSPYECYKAEIFRRICEDKNRRNREHRDLQYQLVLNHLEKKKKEKFYEGKI